MDSGSGALDELVVLLRDWRVHVRARNRGKATIDSYTRCTQALAGYLSDRDMPSAVKQIRREHLEALLADLADRVSPATTAKHYRSLQQFFRWLEEDGEMTCRRWRA